MTTILSIPSFGSIEQYQTAVNSIPMLTEEDEKELFKRYKEQDCLKSAHKLVSSYLRIVPPVARQFKGVGVPIEDLIQEGNIALMRSVRDFNPEFGVRISSYSVKWVRYAIMEFVLQNWGPVKTITTKSHRKIFYNLWKFKQSHYQLTGKDTLNAEAINAFCEKYSVTKEEVLDASIRLEARAEYIGSDDYDEDDPYSSPIQDETLSPESVIAKLENQYLLEHKIPEIIESLNAREKEIIQSRWIDVTDSGIGVTLDVLSQKFNVSKERVRQIEQAALKKIKQRIVEE